MNGMILECTCTLISVVAKDFVETESQKHIITHKANLEVDGEIYTFTVDNNVASEFAKCKYHLVKIGLSVSCVNGRNYLKIVNFELLKK